MMKFFDAQATADRLPYPELAESLRQILRDREAGIAQAPPRNIVSLHGGGTLLVMPAADHEIAITKLVTVHPNNHLLNLPSIIADVVVMDVKTGQRVCMLDGATVTARRTAALSLLAAKTLAANTDGPLLIVGAGVQGRAHLEAFVAGLGVRHVFITSRTLAKSEALAAYARTLGVMASAVESAETVLPSASLIVTGTTSQTPVMSAAVRPDAFVAAVGAYNHHMAELPPDLVRNANLFVDSLEGAQAEAGDLLQADIDWQSVTPLAKALDAAFVPPAQLKTRPTIFKSVGHALWDLAAARLVVDRIATA